MNPLKFITLAATLSLALTAPLAADSAVKVDDAAIKKILVDRIDAQKKGVGIVVGIIEPSGRRIIAHGRRSVEDAKPVDGSTLFEIGSVSKVFTALLLTDAVTRGEVALNDPLSKHLPEQVNAPKSSTREVTLADLATHTSALPRLPANLAPKNGADPYADYGDEELYAFLTTLSLSREPGSRYEYSNLGAGLLGTLLARRAGSDYETLVRKRIAEPLAMRRTAVNPAQPLRSNIAAGHSAEQNEVPSWNFKALAGAGGLRSSADDLLTFLAAAMGIEETKLKPAMHQMLATSRETGTPGMNIALGWHRLKSPSGGEIIWHNGGTGGFRSFVGYEPSARRGVVVLSNMFTPEGVDDLGRHLLDPSFPLLVPAKPREEISVDEATLERYVGRYELAPEFIITITREGKKLYLQATGQPRFQLFAEKATSFFLKVVEARVSFELGEEGAAKSMTLHQNGADVPGKRIDAAGETRGVKTPAP